MFNRLSNRANTFQKQQTKTKVGAFNRLSKFF